MQSPSPPFRRPPGDAAPPTLPVAAGNEFAAAVSRLVEIRERRVERPVVLPRLDPEPVPEAADTDSAASPRWRRAGPLAVGAAALLGLAVLALGWLRPADPVASPVTAVPVRLPVPSGPPVPAVAEPAAVPQPGPTAAAAPPEAAPAPNPPPAPAAVSLPTVLPAPLGRDEVRELQSRLRALGFAPGPVDGIAGGKTEVALQRYRESRRLGERLAARELLERLRAEPPSR